MSRGYLSHCYNEICDRVGNFTKSKKLNKNEVSLTKTYRRISHYFPYVINKIGRAKNIIKEKELNKSYKNSFLFRLKKLWATIILRLGLGIINARYAPAVLTFFALKMQYSFHLSSAILKAIKDNDENPFIDFFEKYVVPKIADGTLNWLGFQ